MVIELTNYRRSDVVEGAVDIDVRTYLASEGGDALIGRQIDGEITVRPRGDRPDVWHGGGGEPEHWATADLVRLGRETLERIEALVDHAACAAAVAE